MAIFYDESKVKINNLSVVLYPGHAIPNYNVTICEFENRNVLNSKS